jgi:cytochrome P450
MEPLREFCRARLRARKGRPGDDLASDIANGEIDGRPIDEDIATNMLSLIYIAGHGTTTTGMQGAVVCLADHPEAQQVLRLEPRRIPAAIEECLRLETPLHALPRYCTRAAELGGRPIAAGDQVYPVYAAANLDPEQFPDPTRFEIDRKPHHFSFGRGIHICAGAPLARLQMRVLIEEMLARTKSFRLTERLKRGAWPHYRAERLPISVEP